MILTFTQMEKAVQYIYSKVNWDGAVKEWPLPVKSMWDDANVITKFKSILVHSGRYFPKGFFPECQLPKCENCQAATSQIKVRLGPLSRCRRQW